MRLSQITRLLCFITFLFVTMVSTFDTTLYPSFWKQHDHTIRVLVIGDSVDRNAVIDYCYTEAGILCQVARSCHLNDTVPYKTKNFTEHFTNSKYTQAGIKMCFVERLNAIVGFVFNHNGVANRPFCGDLTPNRCAYNSPDVVDYYMNNSHSLPLPLENFVNLSLSHTVKTMVTLMGGKFHGVLMQSSLWDLQRLQECDDWKEDRDGTESFLQSWFLNWVRNATHFAKIIKTSDWIASNVSYVAWRTLHPFPRDRTVKDNHYYRRPAREPLLQKLNNASRNVIVKAVSGLQLIDFWSFPDAHTPRHKTFDRFHPNFLTSAALVSVLVKNTQKAVYHQP